MNVNLELYNRFSQSFFDNGLKLFGPDGLKLSDRIQKIENIIDKEVKNHLSQPKLLGRVKRLETGTEKYLEIQRKDFQSNLNKKYENCIRLC